MDSIDFSSLLLPPPAPADVVAEHDGDAEASEDVISIIYLFLMSELGGKYRYRGRAPLSLPGYLTTTLPTKYYM